MTVKNEIKKWAHRKERQELIDEIAHWNESHAQVRADLDRALATERTLRAELATARSELRNTQIVLQQTAVALASAVGVDGALASTARGISLMGPR